jgi:hypothetical protein
VDERDERDEERGMYIVLLDCSEVNSLTVDGIYRTCYRCDRHHRSFESRVDRG